MNSLAWTIVAVMGLVLLLALMVVGYPLFCRKYDEEIKAIRLHLQGTQGIDPQAIAAMQNALEALSQNQRQLPHQILRCIQGNINTLKGQAAELVAYLQLNAAYDRLLPFNNIADFIGIKFPQGEDAGRLDFIEIKTGNARLSQEQIKLKRLIEDKRINFVKLTIKSDQPSLTSEESECENT